jgi:DNA-binding FadR family transcriptional regulator
MKIENLKRFHLGLLDACFEGDVEKAKECIDHLGAHTKAVLNSSPNGSDTFNYLFRYSINTHLSE